MKFIIFILIMFIVSCTNSGTISYVKTNKGCYELRKGFGIAGITATKLDCDSVEAILKVYAKNKVSEKTVLQKFGQPK